MAFSLSPSTELINRTDESPCTHPQGDFDAGMSAGAASASFQSFQGAAAVDDLARIFNTAVVSTRTQESHDISAELYSLMETPAFGAILTAVRELAGRQGIPESKAAEQIIQAFRKLDGIWGSYVFQEGVTRLRSQNLTV